MPVLYVALGGAIGSVFRYLAIQQVMARINPNPFPLGTMLVNMIGSFLIGILMSKLADPETDASLRLFFVTGILGGFTTFSAFSWDAIGLLQRGALLQAMVYIGGSVLLSLIAVALGILVMR